MKLGLRTAPHYHWWSNHRKRSSLPTNEIIYQWDLWHHWVSNELWQGIQMRLLYDSLLLKNFECHDLHLTINCLLHYDLQFFLHLFFGILNFIILYFGTILLCSCFRKTVLVWFDTRNGRLWCWMFREWKDMLFMEFLKIVCICAKVKMKWFGVIQMWYLYHILLWEYHIRIVYLLHDICMCKISGEHL
jgi:hypothetical protein